jgi:hypothetical protein
MVSPTRKTHGRERRLERVGEHTHIYATRSRAWQATAMRVIDEKVEVECLDLSEMFE